MLSGRAVPAALAGFVTALAGLAVLAPAGAAQARVADAQPVVQAISVSSGPVAGGTTVVITGTGFEANRLAVDFGTEQAARYTLDSRTQITAVSPPGANGPAGVSVTTAGGRSPAVLPDVFSYATLEVYQSCPGDLRPLLDLRVSPGHHASMTDSSGGTSTTTVTGTTANPATNWWDGAELNLVLNTGHTLSVSLDGGAAQVIGSYDIGAACNQVTWHGSATPAPPPAAPAVTSVSPGFGPVTGGTNVTISGTGFRGATAVHFGGSLAQFVVNSDSSISARAPRGSTGPVDVTVIAGNQASPAGPADQFSYGTARLALRCSAHRGSLTLTVSPDSWARLADGTTGRDVAARSGDGSGWRYGTEWGLRRGSRHQLAVILDGQAFRLGRYRIGGANCGQTLWRA